MKYLLIFCSPLLFLVSIACKSAKVNTDNIEKHVTPSIKPSNANTKLVSISKGACYGSCPIYSMTVFEDGSCKFHGKRFCKKLGPFIGSISAQELATLNQKISVLKLSEYPDKIESLISDFPSTEITVFSDSNVKSVWWRDNEPKELSELSTFLDKFRTDMNWEFDVNAPMQPGTIENQILVELKSGIKATEFVNDYSDFALKINKELTPKENYWLFEFDNSKISGGEMLKLIYKSEKINNAEFNKELEQRH